MKAFKFLIFFLLFSSLIYGEGGKDKINSSLVSGLKFRNIGPAFTSGRIADFAVNPKNHSEYYVGVACGNVWKTENNGTTWKPVFENYGSYSIGVVEIDPNNTNVVWIGTGENNHQRALGYGDGIYKSLDGGKSWKNMGLKDSRHIGGIIIDPRNSNVVYVAAEGSAWGPGGERGLYKTVDGGKTWERILFVSENTGINNIIYDPRDPDVLYATSEQRRRHVFTKIGGGPESAVYKSEDAGKTWRKIMKGLPNVDLGGMGIAISPANPDVLYLIVEAQLGKGGFFRSTDRGETWVKMSNHSSSGQYYNEIYCDPKDVDKVYSVETFSHYTEDGGKTWKRLGIKNKHVDDHALWIDPDDTKHFMIGSDGGIYETFDGGLNYLFKCNLPVTQFYRVNVDNEYPFYNVYGGTQDNNSMGGPSRTLRSSGIVNDDWFITNGGDGFWGAIDPKDPNIVYAESQYGGMVRYDRRSGESVYIRPEPRKGEKTYKWNWNTPLFISPHSNTRLYCAANKVFRSDDRGNNWEVISDDITAQIDRNSWPVMEKYWSIDAVAKDVSTSLFGTAVAMDESPVKENLLYVGTDDGLIQVSEDAKTWRKIDEFPGVPKYTYVSDIKASRFDENVVYASFDNRKRDDFKPYLLVSKDKGQTWESIANNLPENGTVHTIEQDFKNPDLLFAGTEFGIYFSVDGGKEWVQLKSGLPTIAVRDIAIQQRESDLVLATFGRGFYILDDYSPLRELNAETVKKDAYIFPVKDSFVYVQKRGRYGQGATYFSAPNPPFGATFTYYLKDVPKTEKSERHKKEKELFKKGEKIPQPSIEKLREEEKEIKPHLLFLIYDENNNVIRKFSSPAKKGINRVVWDLRFQNKFPFNLKENKFNPLENNRGLNLVAPGKYSVKMFMVSKKGEEELFGPISFNVKTINNTTLPAKNRKEVVEFENKAFKLVQVIKGTEKHVRELIKKVEFIKQSLYRTPESNYLLWEKANSLHEELDNILFRFTGPKAKASSEEIPPVDVPLNSRVSTLSWTRYRSTSDITGNEKAAYKILLEEFPPIYKKVKEISEVKMKQIEQELNKLGAPYTPGNLPDFSIN